MRRRARLGAGARGLAAVIAVTAIGCAPTYSERERSLEQRTMVERGARGAEPAAPSPPSPSVEAPELGPPALPARRSEALRAARGWLGRLERRRAALDHPLDPTPPLPPLPSTRRRAHEGVARLEDAAETDWPERYVDAWRHLRDYEVTLRRAAADVGLRPHRVRTQPWTAPTERPVPDSPLED